MIHQPHWTFADALEVVSDQTKEKIFDLVIKGEFILDKEGVGKLADWAYPTDPREEPS